MLGASTLRLWLPAVLDMAGVNDACVVPDVNGEDVGLIRGLSRSPVRVRCVDLDQRWLPGCRRSEDGGSPQGGAPRSSEKQLRFIGHRRGT